MPSLPSGNKPAHRPAVAVVHCTAAVGVFALDIAASRFIGDLRLAVLAAFAAGYGGVEVVHDAFVVGHFLGLYASCHSWNLSQTAFTVGH